MRKLLRYELYQHYLPISVICAIFCACLFLSLWLMRIDLPDLRTPSVFAQLIITARVAAFTGLVISMMLILMAHLFLIISAFGKNLFGDYGYLLFCLPISIDAILLAKIFSCFILIGASVCFVVFVSTASIVTIYDGNTWLLLSQIATALRDIFAQWSQKTLIALLYIITSILGWTLTTLTYILLTLALLNTFRISSFRFVLGVLLFFGICLCGGLIDTMLGLPLSAIALDGLYKMELLEFEQANIALLWGSYIYKLISYLVLSGASYLLARYLIIKKLELD